MLFLYYTILHLDFIFKSSVMAQSPTKPLPVFSRKVGKRFPRVSSHINNSLSVYFLLDS